jgi:hypothetical protein
VGAELLHADERADMTNLTDVFRNLVKVLKIEGTVHKKVTENITITNSTMRYSSKSECVECQRGI